jgi:branched-chain amino acid transport system substrate-binding protein
MSMLRRVSILALVLLAPLLSGCSEEIKIGAVISESGAVESYGERVRNGMDLALEEINAEGGFKGNPFHLIYKDDGTNTNVGRQVTQELIEQDEVSVIIGAISSPVTLGIAPICQENQVVLLSPSSSAPAVSQMGDFIFRNYPSDVLEGTSMARFARDLGLERVVIFAINNEFGHGLRDIFTEQYENKYRSVIKTYDFDDSQAEGFQAMVDEVKESAPDGIYLLAYLDKQAELLKLIREAGIESVLMGTSAVLAKDLVRLAGDAADNLIYSRSVFDVNSSDPTVSSFVTAYKTKYGQDPDLYAAHGYDALKLLLEAMENGKSSRATDIKLGLGAIEQYEGAAGATAFDEDGDVVRYPRMFIIQQGVSQPYEKFVEEGGSLFSGG